MSRLTIKEVATKPDPLLSGHRLCSGCGEALAARLVMKAVRGPTIVTVATGCLEVSTSIYPYTSWSVPWIHSAFENAAATASGIEAAYKAMRIKGSGPLAKYEKLDVIAFAGDGGTYDIGFQALSGALERGHDMLYVLLDNEAYMNTGIQRSGGTPYTAWTTTSPAGSVIHGKPEHKKPIADIVVAHGVPYVATATVSEPMDLVNKARRGLEADGPAFLHVLCPCPRGWRTPPDMTVEMARLAVKTCFFPLWEAVLEDGRVVYKLSGMSRAIARKPELKLPVEEYLKVQGRFRHLFKPKRRDDLIEVIQSWVDQRWENLLKLAGEA